MKNVGIIKRDTKVQGGSDDENSTSVPDIGI